jgi:hypothetical protein
VGSSVETTVSGTCSSTSDGNLNVRVGDVDGTVTLIQIIRNLGFVNVDCSIRFGDGITDDRSQANVNSFRIVTSEERALDAVLLGEWKGKLRGCLTGSRQGHAACPGPFTAIY